MAQQSVSSKKIEVSSRGRHLEHCLCCHKKVLSGTSLKKHLTNEHAQELAKALLLPDTADAKHQWLQNIAIESLERTDERAVLSRSVEENTKMEFSNVECAGTGNIKSEPIDEIISPIKSTINTEISVNLSNLSVNKKPVEKKEELVNGKRDRKLSFAMREAIQSGQKVCGKKIEKLFSEDRRTNGISGKMKSKMNADSDMGSATGIETKRHLKTSKIVLGTKRYLTSNANEDKILVGKRFRKPSLKIRDNELMQNGQKESIKKLTKVEKCSSNSMEDFSEECNDIHLETSKFKKRILKPSIAVREAIQSGQKWPLNSNRIERNDGTERKMDSLDAINEVGKKKKVNRKVEDKAEKEDSRRPQRQRHTACCRDCGQLVKDPEKHVLTQHINLRLFQCPLCHFYSNHFENSVLEHIKRAHPTAHVTPIRNQEAQEIQFQNMFERCFETKVSKLSYRAERQVNGGGKLLVPKGKERGWRPLMPVSVRKQQMGDLSNPNVCQLCRHLVSISSLRKRHVLQHHFPKVVYQCNSCNHVSYRLNIVQAHVDSTHRNEPNAEPICHLTKYAQDIAEMQKKCFPMKPTRSQHKSMFTYSTVTEKERKLLYCKLCDCGTKEKAFRHALSHLNKPVYICPMCGKSNTSNVAEIKKHIDKEHKGCNIEPTIVTDKYKSEIDAMFEQCFDTIPRTHHQQSFIRKNKRSNK